MVGTLANTTFTERLIRFREKYPSVRVALRTARSNEISDLVRDGTVHLGLRYFENTDTDLVSRLVAKEPLVVVGAAYHEWKNLSKSNSLRYVTWHG